MIVYKSDHNYSVAHFFNRNETRRELQRKLAELRQELELLRIQQSAEALRKMVCTKICICDIQL